jgi:hypothetical protein
VPTLHARAMRRAAEIYGEEALARHLGVRPIQLAVWMSGAVAPPLEAFLKVADILGDHALRELKKPPQQNPSKGDAP